MYNRNGAIKIRKLNVKKLFATVIIGFVLLIILIICIYNAIEENKRKEAAYEYSKQMAEIQEQERIAKEEEEKRKQILLENKYNPLTADEFSRIDNIFNHSDTKRVFLTFDDGPTTQVTPFILDLLKKEKIKANFFVLGSMVNRNPDLVKREYEEGHYIANHSYTHRYKDIYQNADTVLEEYNQTNDAIKKAVENPKFNSLIFRFPGGSTGGYYADIKTEAVQKLKENGIASIDWNALTKDAEGAHSKESIMDNLRATSEDKTSVVLLMHDASDKILTYEALPDVINYFREKGYQFQTFFDAMGREIE